MNDFDGAVAAEPPAPEPELIPLPRIMDQYTVIRSLFPTSTSEEREAFKGYRNIISGFAGQNNIIRENLVDNTELDLFETGDLAGRMRINRVIMVAAARFLMEALDAETPSDLHFGRTIYGQFLENLEKVGLPQERARELVSKDELYAAWNEYAEGHKLLVDLFPDTKLAEDEVEQVLDVDSSSDTPQGADGQAYVLGE